MGRVHRNVGTGERPDWEGVDRQVYEESGAEGATRRILIGPEEGAGSFAVRYFEIPPGKASSLDNHAHDHGVYVVRGSADLLLGSETHHVGPGDAIYIEPHETHQFRVTSDEALGFLCVVPPRP